MDKLTVAQAIEQGYENFFYNEDGWQPVKSLKDDEIDWRKKGIVLAEKESGHPTAPDNDDIRELLAEYASSTYADETGADDTDSVYQAIKAMDFSDVSERIQERLNKINYYVSSSIELIP